MIINEKNKNTNYYNMRGEKKFIIKKKYKQQQE